MPGVSWFDKLTMTLGLYPIRESPRHFEMHLLKERNTAGEIADNTRAMYLSSLSTFFSYVVSKKWLAQNPVDELGWPKDVCAVVAGHDVD